MLRLKPILAICAIIAITAVTYFSAKKGYWHQKDSVTQQPTPKGHWHGDVWHDQTHASKPTSIPKRVQPVAEQNRDAIAIHSGIEDNTQQASEAVAAPEHIADELLILSGPPVDA